MIVSINKNVKVMQIQIIVLAWIVFLIIIPEVEIFDKKILSKFLDKKVRYQTNFSFLQAVLLVAMCLSLLIIIANNS